MKKLIVFASALALSGSMAFAMEKDAMDEEMMMEAPSVTLSGAAKLGFKNVDDDNKPDAESIHLIRKYQVNFSSSGTTDGGLAFGAGISIEDEQGIDNDATQVNGSNVYIGAADGSWKLKLGGNDPGIDLAGGFGVADEHFGGEDDKTIGLEGSFGGTSYRITMADPQKGSAADSDWSAGVSHSINTISVGVGMDSEDGLAVSIGTDLSGVSTSLYWSKSEFTGKIIVEDDGANTIRASQENSGLGVKASMSAGEGATFSVGYSILKAENSNAMNSAEAQNAFNDTLKTKLIEVDFSYDLGGGATLEAGIDKKDAESHYSLSDAAADGIIAGDIKSIDTTTLEAAIAFSF